jgi:hypothetical protein
VRASSRQDSVDEIAEGGAEPALATWVRTTRAGSVATTPPVVCEQRDKKEKAARDDGGGTKNEFAEREQHHP